jgi:hypothetical protein
VFYDFNTFNYTILSNLLLEKIRICSAEKIQRQFEGVQQELYQEQFAESSET